MTLVASSATSPTASRSGSIPAPCPFDSIPLDVMTPHAADRYIASSGRFDEIYFTAKIAPSYAGKAKMHLSGNNVVSCEYLF